MLVIRLTHNIFGHVNIIPLIHHEPTIYHLINIIAINNSIRILTDVYSDLSMLHIQSFSGEQKENKSKNK
jgi:hypothetical protein